MPIFMDEFNPPQIFYVVVDVSVIFVVEVRSGATWIKASKKEK